MHCRRGGPIPLSFAPVGRMRSDCLGFAARARHRPRIQDAPLRELPVRGSQRGGWRLRDIGIVAPRAHAIADVILRAAPECDA
jgi:hypothetical protein